MWNGIIERFHEFNGRTTEMNYDMMGRLTYPACFRICEHMRLYSTMRCRITDTSSTPHPPHCQLSTNSSVNAHHVVPAT
jgi:hypothetical protein